jgi:hypothetical protein
MIKVIRASDNVVIGTQASVALIRASAEETESGTQTGIVEAYELDGVWHLADDILIEDGTGAPRRARTNCELTGVYVQVSR